MKTAVAQGTLFVLSAPSGAGKTSLVNAIVQRHDHISLSVSHTTRPAREQESDGVHYHFVKPGCFQKMADAGEFLEHARVFDHRYGTATAAVNQKLADGDDVILEIDWQGAAQVRDNMPGCCSIFILPPSRQALSQRLAARGQDSDAVIAQRMAEAEAEMSHYREFDYLVVNDEFEQAFIDLEHIILTQRLRRDRQQGRYRAMIAELLGDS